MWKLVGGEFLEFFDGCRGGDGWLSRRVILCLFLRGDFYYKGKYGPLRICIF